jgi:hypothetical protein
VFVCLKIVFLQQEEVSSLCIKVLSRAVHSGYLLGFSSVTI